MMTATRTEFDPETTAFFVGQVVRVVTEPGDWISGGIGTHYLIKDSLAVVVKVYDDVVNVKGTTISDDPRKGLTWQTLNLTDVSPLGDVEDL